MKKFAQWYAKASGIMRDFVDMLFALTIFYSGFWIQERIYKLIESEKYHVIVVETIFVFILGCIFVVIRGIFRRVYEELKDTDIRQRRSFEVAAASMQRIVAERIRETRTPIHEPKAALRDAIASVGCLRNIVKSLYAHLEGEFGEAELLHERIDFEVTFMTLSYVDNKITIPAFGNRSARAPLSMKMRAVNPNIYESTVTAELFKSTKPEIRIVEDTSDPNQQYRELYDGQLDRIKSSVVYPVFDDRNGLLGTLVVHCNRSNFFKRKDEIFWKELLERYAVQLAFEKSRFDLLKSTKLLLEDDWEETMPF